MLYAGETVRLIHPLSEPALPQHAEGSIAAIRRDEHGAPVALDVRFYISSKMVAATVPLDAVELVLSATGGCTAVFWKLAKPSRPLVEDAINAMLDHGFEMREGLNVVRLQYDHQDHFWRKAERLSDPTGAIIAVSAPDWDGCIAGFSGQQRFELEFRLYGHRDPCVLLHQRWETYQEQQVTTHSAMTLLRVLLNLYHTLQAEYCAVPVADNWILDESWDSLLQQPYFPDLFILPQAKLPAQLPPVYRAGRLVNEKAILTTLPIKFSPTDDPIQPTQRELKLNQLRVCKAIGEKAYDQLYEAHGSTAGLYSDAKEAFYDAIRVARELGLEEEVAALEKRLAHIKAVYRNQFT